MLANCRNHAGEKDDDPFNCIWCDFLIKPRRSPDGSLTWPSQCPGCHRFGWELPG